MKVDHGSWESFEQWLGDLKSTCGSSRILFRGQGNSEWLLESTLERHGQKTMSVRDYYRLILSVGPAVETFLGVKVPEYDRELEQRFSNLESFFDQNRYPDGDDYRYLVYLRHHGFPSPLLDWSYSPYVAGFFALRDGNATHEMRSIYAYCETLTGAKGGAVGEPTIRTLGPYVRSHPRHFRQQSDYTLCESLDANRCWQYDSHQHVLNRTRPGQDFFWRFDLSVDERVEVLQQLDRFNLNAYSLFDSEESLLETMWLREHAFKANR